MSEPAPSRGSSEHRSPYARARTGELSEPLLPRWFVILAVALVPVAVAVFLVAFPFFSPGEPVPVADRRPPPDDAGSLTHDVGAVELGEADPQPAESGCSAVEGFAVAGTDQDRLRLEQAIDVFCQTPVPDGAGPAFAELRDAGAILRFAVFEVTPVDSAVDVGEDPPVVLVNARFAQIADPRSVAPLLIHDAVTVAGRPGTVDTALAARRAELAVCRELFDPDDFPRGCLDAEELLALEDPAAALRESGYD